MRTQETQDQELQSGLTREGTLELASWQDLRQPPCVFHSFCQSEATGSSFHAFALLLSDYRLLFFGATCIGESTGMSLYVVNLQGQLKLPSVFRQSLERKSD